MAEWHEGYAKAIEHTHHTLDELGVPREANGAKLYVYERIHALRHVGGDPCSRSGDGGHSPEHDQQLWRGELFRLMQDWHSTRDGSPSKADAWTAIFRHVQNMGSHWRARAFLAEREAAGLAQSKQEPLSDEQLMEVFAGLDGRCTQDAALMRMDAEGACVDTVELLGARHGWRAFLRAAKAIEAAHGIAAAVSQSKQPTPPEAEIEAWLWQRDETGHTGFVDAWQVENGWQEANPSCRLIRPLVFAPDATPPNAPPNASGCDFCRNPLFAGTKCKNCGRTAPIVTGDLEADRAQLDGNAGVSGMCQQVQAPKPSEVDK